MLLNDSDLDRPVTHGLVNGKPFATLRELIEQYATQTVAFQCDEYTGSIIYKSFGSVCQVNIEAR